MKYLNWVGYVSIPLAYLVHYRLGRGTDWEPIVTFILAGLGVVPLAHLMGEATEALSEKAGPTWGGLLNATFGNAAELIIAIIALSKGLNEIVKASLTGSILGNLLLVAGASMLIGGWKHKSQKFSRAAAESSGGMLLVAVAAMLLPAIFHFTAERLQDAERVDHEHAVSIATSVVLIATYILGLVFTLRTHSHLFTHEPGHPDDPETSGAHAPAWSVKRAIGMLLLASVGIGVVAELLVGSAEQVAHNLGWNPVFVGVILLAIVGNAAEHSTAVMLALKNDMNTALTITNQSSLQIALFATPLLVFVSRLLVVMHVGESHPLDLVFTPLEVVAVIVAVLTVITLTLNGESNWFEGVLLLALYAIMAIVFFYIPMSPGVAVQASHP
ncbi:calcium/proton exchanger [soil metagenome]